MSLVLLAGCSSLTSYEPRSSQSVGGQQSYVVRSGDTVYSIAWRYGLDPANLARWNDLADPGRIVVGQRLVLTPPASAGRASGGSPSRPPVARPPAGNAPPAFSWPARGTVVARFGDPDHFATGIGIAGRLGQDVVAAAPGRVIYAGSAGADYGQLVVIEHNAAWLTAYRNNRNLLVAENQTVSRGQKIGEMGLGPLREPRLYFEIRQNGDPLDPMLQLPPPSD